MKRQLISETHTARARRLAVALGRKGPYAAIMVVVPGGSLIALLFWLYRMHRGGRSVTRVTLTRLRSAIQGVASSLARG